VCISRRVSRDSFCIFQSWKKKIHTLYIDTTTLHYYLPAGRTAEKCKSYLAKRGTVPLDRGARLVWGRHKCSPRYTHLSKEPNILSKEPNILSKEPYILWGRHNVSPRCTNLSRDLIKRALHSLKRALHSLKRALHSLKRALHSLSKEPYILSQKSPTCSPKSPAFFEVDISARTASSFRMICVMSIFPPRFARKLALLLRHSFWRLYTYIHVHMEYIHTYVMLYVHMYAYTHMYVYMHTYTRTHTHTHTLTHTARRSSSRRRHWAGRH